MIDDGSFCLRFTAWTPHYRRRNFGALTYGIPPAAGVIVNGPFARLKRRAEAISERAARHPCPWCQESSGYRNYTAREYRKEFAHFMAMAGDALLNRKVSSFLTIATGLGVYQLCTACGKWVGLCPECALPKKVTEVPALCDSCGRRFI